jgi:hypothetical protein
MLKKILSVLLFSLVSISIATTSAVAASQTQQTSPHILGVVVPRNKNLPMTTPNPLTFHGGSVMHTNKTYAIYWVPAGYGVDSHYESLINGYFKNVAIAHNNYNNVYYPSQQYYDFTNGYILDQSTYGGAYVDTHAFPGSACSDASLSLCLSDAQIQAEIDRVVHVKGWSRNGTDFFLFTPFGVGSCAGASCAFSTYCAYHSSFISAYTGTETLYANMPYADTYPIACDAGIRPNNDDADPEISVISHEHNETITDPFGTGWWDPSTGAENGDNCAWNFGSSIGSTTYGAYNQQINTGKYYIQQEWSNNQNTCVLAGP